MKRPQEDAIETVDGIDLFSTFLKAPSATGILLIVHGYGEHCGMYMKVAQFYQSMGFHVMMYDLRGHGKSPGDRGDLASVELCIDDLDLLVARCKDRYPSLPVCIMGHNIGASIAAAYVLRREGHLPALVLSCLPFNLRVSPVQHMMKPFFKVFDHMESHNKIQDFDEVHTDLDSLAHDEPLTLCLSIELDEVQNFVQKHRDKFTDPLYLNYSSENLQEHDRLFQDALSYSKAQCRDGLYLSQQQSADLIGPWLQTRVEEFVLNQKELAQEENSI